MNSEAAIEPPGSRKMSTTASENSNFHSNVTTEFTIITSLGKWFHFLTIISSNFSLHLPFALVLLFFRPLQSEVYFPPKLDTL